MPGKRTAPKNVDQYIAGFPPDVQAILQRIRRTIRSTVPAAQEAISYQIPAFTLDGKYLIYFAGFRGHVSVYPAPRGAREFKKELAAYRGGKGTVRFPLDKPLPVGLIRRIVKFRMKERLKKGEARPRKK